ncbi:MAG: GHMP kinase [Candidatus Micrarchaeota archaeon]|nr:GHMP kinase [Candidatus Micrarchaeota archaeon]
MGFSIKTRAPLRISLAGGGTDVSPFCDEYGGAVINIAISRYAYVYLSKIKQGIKIKSNLNTKGILYSGKKEFLNNHQQDILRAILKHYLKSKGGYEISFFLDTLPRSGLGSSAAAFVSLIAAFNFAESLGLSKKSIAEQAWYLEREELKNIGGKQDQYASVFGGINFMKFSANDVELYPLRVDQKTILELESRILIFNYAPRDPSGKIIEQQIKNVKEKKKQTIDALLRNKEIAKEITKELLQTNIDKVGLLLDESWQEKKKYSSYISNSDLDKFYNKLKSLGVIGGKISGAGGGGHMFLLCQENKTLDVYYYLLNSGFNPFFLKIDWEGVIEW